MQCMTYITQIVSAPGLLRGFDSQLGTRGRIQRKTWCMGPYMPELTITSPYVDSNTFTIGNPLLESTLILGQSRLYPQVRDFGFGVYTLRQQQCWKLQNILYSMFLNVAPREAFECVRVTDCSEQLCGNLPQSATRPLKTYSTAIRAIPFFVCHQGPPSGNRTGLKKVPMRSNLFS
jgi:hypothetical protein